jgi:hypothetical protein
MGVTPRTVRAPDGRVWQVRRCRYRLPPKPEPEDEADLEGPLSTGRIVIGPFGPILAALARLVQPAWEATVGHRPWIAASAEDPPVTMVWRATGRRSAQTALDEIADALERGETRPQPFWAHWTGYDRGGIRLARKER